MNIELQEAINNALENYKSNKKSGSPAESLSYDMGRIDGLKQVMEIVEKTYQEAINCTK